ncbi:MAG TPA: glycosyltransferase, partial [Gemmatimonadaceae bacterium]|nr:glycosyltransferase [Gemmatimonadaceae bacterium]
MLTILQVAYSLAAVGPDVAGGAEQVLAELDRAVFMAGHHSIVVACAGSRVHGTLVETPRASGPITDAVHGAACAAQARAIAAVLERWPVDVVHLHGVDFHRYLPEPGVSVLATLHLPPDWYPAEALSPTRPRTHLNCVSASQRRACPPGVPVVDTIVNGVRFERFAPATRRRDFVLALGRICPEKGYHLALDAARRAHVAMILAGEVFGYEAHERYFRDEIAPRLSFTRRFVGGVGRAGKRRLLGAARCLLVPSLVPETSSLVAMEALASGTPVVAFPAGALAEIVDDGVTGFLVRDEREMADAIDATRALDAEACRTAARERYSADRMARRYLEAYDWLA